MKRTLLLLLLPLLLTSCSNPDTSGGVTLSRGGDDANEFPYGSCEGQGKNPTGGRTGCGWIHVNEESHYIMPSARLKYADLNFAGLRYANLQGANLRNAILIGTELGDADLRGADLTDADLRFAGLTYADLRGAELRGANLLKANLRGAILNQADVTPVIARSRTTCPDGTKGDDCQF